MRTIHGIEVIDAQVDDVLEITQEDIDNSVPMDEHNCAIAVAWRRSDPTIKDTIVCKSRAFKMKDRFGYLKYFRYYVSRPIMIQEAILDNGGRFAPGTYVLKAMPKSKKTGSQQGSDKPPGQKPKPTLVKEKKVRVVTPMRANAPTQST